MALAVRDTAVDITAAPANQKVHVVALDLADQGSVAAFVANWTGAFDILVNNAGVMGPPLTRTAEGWELHFATNHYGHFALTNGLYPALAAAGGARVVSVSSSQHRNSPVVFDDIHFQQRPYGPQPAYGQSKTANALFAVEAARRWSGEDISVNAVMPGVIRTNLMRHVHQELLARHARRGAPQPPWKTIGQGAATSVLAALSPHLNGVSENTTRSHPEHDTQHGAECPCAALKSPFISTTWAKSATATSAKGPYSV